jgi:hypothetical protein
MAPRPYTMPYTTFPTQALTLAARHSISPALAFGLGEGLNLYYRRQLDGAPPHVLHVVPHTFGDKISERLEQPRAGAIAAALASNANGVMVCTGDWHGLDAIEKWSEELPFWDTSPGWEESVRHAADLIEASDGLYRRAYAHFLDEALPYYNELSEARAMLDEIADDWLEIAACLRSGTGLEGAGSRVLRMAGRESRFWGRILDRFR